MRLSEPTAFVCSVLNCSVCECSERDRIVRDSILSDASDSSECELGNRGSGSGNVRNSSVCEECVTAACKYSDRGCCVWEFGDRDSAFVL